MLALITVAQLTRVTDFAFLTCCIERQSPLSLGNSPITSFSRARFKQEAKIFECSMSDKPEQRGAIPYMISPDCKKHIDWLKDVFDGKLDEIYYTDDTKTKVMHCSVIVNEGYVFLADNQEKKADESETSQDPPKDGIKGVMFHIEWPNEERLDAVWKTALDNGAKTVVELAVQSWGDKYGVLVDPFGYQWSFTFASKSDEPPPSKMKKTEE